MSQVSLRVPSEVVSFGVGIDTARYGHHVSFLDEQKRSAAKSFHFTESAAGYQQFQAALVKLAEKHPGVHFHIRLDAAGQYAENLLQWLHRLPLQSTASNKGPIAEELIRQKVHVLRQEQAAFAALGKLVEQAASELPDSPLRRLRTIPGIGPQTAAALVAKIVTIDRFATPTALIGYFGVFPEEVDVSGTDRQGNPKQGTEVRMSRKGNDLVRRLLYTAAQVAVQHTPPVKALFARLRADGKEYNVCLGHCMAKLLRQVFALWTKDCDFDPAFESRANAKSESATSDPDKRDATGLKGQGPGSTRSHRDVPNSPSTERPSVGCASAEPTSILPEVHGDTRRKRRSPSTDSPDSDHIASS